MKRYITILFLCGCLLTVVNAEESITQLLRNDDWSDRDKAVSLIKKDFEQYQYDENLKQAVLSALIEENNNLKYLRANKLIRPPL